jgi:transposase-like protein
VDETYIRAKGKWVYLYRGVDSSGATIDFLLSAKRDAAAAERFLAKALVDLMASVPHTKRSTRRAEVYARSEVEAITRPSVTA